MVCLIDVIAFLFPLRFRIKVFYFKVHREWSDIIKWIIKKTCPRRSVTCSFYVKLSDIFEFSMIY